MKGTHSQSILGVSAWASMWCTDTSGLLHRIRKQNKLKNIYKREKFPPSFYSPSLASLHFFFPSFLPSSSLSFSYLSLLPCLFGQFFGKCHTFTETGRQSRPHGNSNGHHLTHLHPAPLQCQLCHPLQVLSVECSCHKRNNATSPVQGMWRLY